LKNETTQIEKMHFSIKETLPTVLISKRKSPNSKLDYHVAGQTDLRPVVGT